MSTIKASITDVKLGSLTIQGLLSENGELGIAAVQLGEVLSIPQKNCVRTLEALLSKDAGSPQKLVK